MFPPPPILKGPWELIVKINPKVPKTTKKLSSHENGYVIQKDDLFMITQPVLGEYKVFRNIVKELLCPST